MTLIKFTNSANAASLAEQVRSAEHQIAVLSREMAEDWLSGLKAVAEMGELLQQCEQLPAGVKELARSLTPILERTALNATSLMDRHG